MSGQKLEGAESEAVLGKLRQCSTDIASLRGMARTTLSDGQERTTFRYITVFRKPGNLRLEAIPTAAVYTLSLMTVADGRLTFIDPASKVAHLANADAVAFKRYLGVPMLPEDFMALVTACVPARLFDLAPEIYRQGDGNLQLRTKEMVFDLNPQTFQPTSAFMINVFDEHVALKIGWENFREVKGQLLPADLKIDIPDYALLMTMSFSSEDINGDYPSKLFEAEIPDGFRIR